MAEIANDSSHVSNTSGQNQSTVQIAPKEQSKEKSKVSLEFTEADMRDITKITQVLDLIKQSGCQIGPGSLDQLLFYNKTDVNFKTMSQFEPSKAFKEETFSQQRVGEYQCFDSEEELKSASNSDSESEQQKEKK